MLIVQEVDKYETILKRHICDFHKKFPEQKFAGCTCSTSYDYKRKKTDNNKLEPTNTTESLPKQSRAAQHDVMFLEAVELWKRNQNEQQTTK